MPGAWPLCSLRSYLCLMMSSDSRVLGRVNTYTHTQTIIQLFTPTPDCLSPFCLKVLSDFTGTKTNSQSDLDLFIRPHWAFYLPFPCRYHTFTQSFTGFTHLFTRRSNFFLLCALSLLLSSCKTFRHLLLTFLNSSNNWLENFKIVCLWDELGCAPTVCLIVGAIVWGTWKEWGQLFTQMVYWWRCEAGQLTVGTQRLLFLVSPSVFKTTVFFPPPSSLQLCLLWMACLIIYRKGKGSSWSNKHVTALYFVFHWEGRVL